MGQAKKRRDALRLQALEFCAQWQFPPSAWEAAICADLENQTCYVVPRAPKRQMARANVRANDCHTNVRSYVENDPLRESKAVTGWRVQWPDFLLHSVIERDNQLICITPGPFEEADFRFIPDPKITWIEDGEFYSATRDGRTVGMCVRRFPEFTIARIAIVRERILAGIDLSKAVDFTDEEMENLKCKYIKNYVNI